MTVKLENDDDAGEGADDAAANQEAALNAKMNAIVVDHLRRERKAMLAEFKQLLGANRPAAGDAASEAAQLREELAAMKRETAEAKAEARLGSVKQEIRAALDAKGVKGRKADAAIALMVAEGQLTVGEDGIQFAVSRIRNKGGGVELAVHDTIAAGIEDWAKTSDAAEFLPSPLAKLNAGDRRTPTVRPVAPRHYDPNHVPTDDEMARNTVAQLQSMGIDPYNPYDGGGDL